MIKSVLLTAAGVIALLLGILGILMPVLPTTPFILLSAGCFAASNKRLYLWLIGTKYLGAIIRNYSEKSGVPAKVKRNSIIYLWSALIISAVACPKLQVIAILAAVGAGVTIHICLLKTKDSIN